MGGVLVGPLRRGRAAVSGRRAVVDLARGRLIEPPGDQRRRLADTRRSHEADRWRIRSPGRLLLDPHVHSEGHRGLRECGQGESVRFHPQGGCAVDRRDPELVGAILRGGGDPQTAMESALGVGPEEADRLRDRVPLDLEDRVRPESASVDDHRLAGHADTGDGDSRTAGGVIHVTGCGRGAPCKGRDEEEHADGHREDGQSDAPRARGSGRIRRCDGRVGDPGGSVPKCHSIVSPFGNPADSESSVALRPRLAAGVLFRGTSDRGPSVPTTKSHDGLLRAIRVWGDGPGGRGTKRGPDRPSAHRCGSHRTRGTCRLGAQMSASGGRVGPSSGRVGPLRMGVSLAVAARKPAWRFGRRHSARRW